MRSLAAFLVLSLVQWAPWLLAGWFPGGDSGRGAAAVVGAGLFALAVVWFDRVVLGPRGRRLGLDADPSLRARVLGGLGVGLLVYGAVFLARAAIGAVTVDGSREVAVVVGVLANGLVVAGYQAVSEEIVFRGALLGVLPRSVRPATAVALSVAVFVAYHLPKWEDLLHGPYALHLVLAGTAFAIAYLRTGSLWLGIGLHWGWNLGAYLLLEAEQPLFQMTVRAASGWGEWGSWMPVAGNAVLLLAAVAWPTRRVRPGRGPRRGWSVPLGGRTS